jgi:hypothetical protein
MQAYLNRLSDSRRKLTPPLHSGEHCFGSVSLLETGRQQVGGRYRILNG